jgi:hypothetical protein
MIYDRWLDDTVKKQKILEKLLMFYEDLSVIEISLCGPSQFISK